MLSTRGDPWARGALSPFIPPPQELGSHQLQDLGWGWQSIACYLQRGGSVCPPTHPAALDHGVGISFLPHPTTASPTR